MTYRDPLWKNVMKPVVTVTGGGTSQSITKTSYRLHEIATNKRVGRIHAAWRHNRWSEDPDAIKTIQIHPIGVSHVQLPADLKNVICFHSHKKTTIKATSKSSQIKSTTLQKTTRDAEIEGLEHILPFKQGPNNLTYPFVTIHLDSKEKCGPSCTCRSLVILGWSSFLDMELWMLGIVGYKQHWNLCIFGRKMYIYVYLGILLGGFKPLIDHLVNLATWKICSSNLAHLLKYRQSVGKPVLTRYKRHHVIIKIKHFVQWVLKKQLLFFSRNS